MLVKFVFYWGVKFIDWILIHKEMVSHFQLKRYQRHGPSSSHVMWRLGIVYTWKISVNINLLFDKTEAPMKCLSNANLCNFVRHQSLHSCMVRLLPCFCSFITSQFHHNLFSGAWSFACVEIIYFSVFKFVIVVYLAHWAYS